MIVKNRDIAYRRFAFIIKLMITAVSLYYIIYQMKSQIHSSNVYSLFLSGISKTFNLSIFILVCLLMFLNWFLEAFKWKLLVSKIEKISLHMALKSVLIGLSVGILTPSRIGEFGGKVFFLEKAERIRAFFIAMLGSLSQLFTTIMFGSVGFIFYLAHYRHIGGLKIALGCSALIIICAFFLWGYPNASLLGIRKGILDLLGKYKRYFLIFKSYKRAELQLVIVLSALRYLVFSLQYFLLLLFFEVKVDPLTGLMLISASYLALSVIPTIALADIGVRGAVSVFFIGLASSNTLGIVSASVLLWLINLAIPALIGSLFIYQLKLYRGSKSESK